MVVGESEWWLVSQCGGVFSVMARAHTHIVALHGMAGTTQCGDRVMKMVGKTV